MKTIAQIDDAEELARTPIGSGWSGLVSCRDLRAASRATSAKAWKDKESRF